MGYIRQSRPMLHVGVQCPLWVKGRHVRCKNLCPLYPNSDRKSGIPHKMMSALPPKADMCSALAHARFGPIADIRQLPS
jgi:hypothetical protein